jgi:outer membrane protein
MTSFTRALSAAAVFLIAAAAPAVAQSTAAQKIAYVDSRKILEQAPGSPKVDSLFKIELAGYEAEVKKMQDGFQKKVEDFNKVKPTLAAAEVDKRSQALGALQQEYSQKTQELQNQADQRRGELLQPVIDQIKLVLEDLRVEQGLSFVFDVSSSSGIVAADKNLDISDRVLAKLRTLPIPALGGVKAADTKAAASKPGAPKTGAPMSAPAGVKPPAIKPE